VDRLIAGHGSCLHFVLVAISAFSCNRVDVPGGLFAAGILMLPVVDQDGARTFRQITLTAIALIAASLLPSLFGLTGVLYFFGALVVSTGLLQVCLWAASSKSNVRAKWLMHATVLHIPLLLG